MNQFIPITSVPKNMGEVCQMWDFAKDPELQNIILTLFFKLQRYDKILCGISGGYDSDIMLDMIQRFGGRGKTTYIFNNTGLEYDATKRHIKELEERYGVEIIELKPKKPIPTCVKEYGVPFWSKHVSNMLYRLQKHNFQWEDEPFEVLYEKYPKCKSALKFWCNEFKTEKGHESKFNIAYIKGLKEFIIQNPPDFKISSKCCDYAKKDPSYEFLIAGDFDLNCTGVRKSEGGIRSARYTSCFDEGFNYASQFRPLFWMTDKHKELYREHFGIIRSDCYEVWGMKRTGCAGCPFGKEFEDELDLVQTHEPKFYKAMNSIFGESYEYTRRFMEFRKTFQGDVT